MVRGFAGFGAAMVMTPIFSALYGPAVGVALCLMLEIAVALPVVPGVVRLVDWRRIGLLLAAAAVGVPFGNLVLTWASPNRCAGRSRPSCSAPSRCWPAAGAYTGQPRPATTLAAGVSSGFLNGLAGMAGPPIAFYYLAGRRNARHACAPTSRPTSCSSTCVAIATFASRGLVDWDTVVLALFLAPAVMLGGVLGARLFPLASESFYRRLALVLLVGVAIGALIL